MTQATSGGRVFARDELDLIAAFAGCSLDESPGSNWVQDVGGLPEYICQVARAIKRSGKSTSRAIAIAVDRMKKWSTGVGVDKDTQAKAAAALAEWEAKRVKSKARTAAKKVAASNAQGGAILALTDADYNVEIVRTAFEHRTRSLRKAWREANPMAGYEECPPSWWVRELWTNYLIVSTDYGTDATLYKIPYEVNDKLDVTFGDPVEVKTQYVVVAETDLTTEMTDADLQNLLTATTARSPYTDRLLRLSAAATGLGKVVSLAANREGTRTARAKLGSTVDGG